MDMLSSYGRPARRATDSQTTNNQNRTDRRPLSSKSNPEGANTPPEDRLGTPLPKTHDRRVQRTHRSLRDALVALLVERGWDEISVQDVCDRADVGRSTFYTHFADKEELLAGGFSELRKAVRAQTLPPSSASAGKPPVRLAFVAGVIDHAHENRRLFKALIGKRGGQVVIRRFRELVTGLVREDLLTGRQPARPDNEATVHFVAGAFFELLTWWLETRNPPPPAEFERLFLNMANAALDAVPL